MDEVRSLAAIPGGKTLDGTQQLPQIVHALQTLCSQANGDRKSIASLICALNAGEVIPGIETYVCP